jgi:hypothetical protein
MKIQAPEVSFCQQSGFNTAISHPVGSHNTQMLHKKTRADAPNYPLPDERLVGRPANPEADA